MHRDMFYNSMNNRAGVSALINNALAGVYFSIHYIELKEDRISKLECFQHSYQLIELSGSASETIKKSVITLSNKAYIPRMYEFTDLSTLDDKLRNSNIACMEFYGAQTGWCRASFVPVMRSEDRSLNSVLYLIQQIDGEVYSLRESLRVEETLNECVSTLSENSDLNYAIDHLLKIIAGYHNSERAYIFEFDEDKEQIHNTYEWCAQGVVPQIDHLKNVNISVIDRWITLFNKVGYIYISSLAEDVDIESAEYQILKEQNVSSLMAAPFWMDGKIMGFLGVDNPKSNTESVILLESVSAFVFNNIQKKRYVDELYDLSFRDRMTGLMNRHAYIRRMEQLEDAACGRLGIIFADINGLKKMNDLYGHERGDQLIKDAAELLKSHFLPYRDSIYRIGGDEFVVFCTDIEEKAFDGLTSELLQQLGEMPIISVGSLWLAQCKDLESQIAYADQLMYERKREYYEKCQKEAGSKHKG